MRAKIGIVGVLGFGLSVTVAVAQSGGQRGAKLLPPRAAEPEVVPLAVRAAAEPLPPFPDSTPVTHINGRPTNNAWLNGTNADPNVVPVGATSTFTKTPSRPTTTTMSVPKEDRPSFMSKGLDKLKSTFASAAQPVPVQQSVPVQQPVPVQLPVETTANTPFRGTGPTGQTVYAGPPAYRWYGWGSVTPGANPYAPTGHFPRASANWFSITGATPGAFPTQVIDPHTLTAGTEPPQYVTSPQSAYAPPASAVSPQQVSYPPAPYQPPLRQQPVTTNPIVPRASSAPAGTEPPRSLPVPAPYQGQGTPSPTMMPVPSVGTALPTMQVVPATVPSMGATSANTPLPVDETEAVGSRVITNAPLTLAPMMVRPTEQATMQPLPTLAVVPPVATLTPTVPPLQKPEAVFVQGAPVVELRQLSAPAQLPVSVTEEQPKWQPTVVTPARTEWKQQ